MTTMRRSLFLVLFGLACTPETNVVRIPAPVPDVPVTDEDVAEPGDDTTPGPSTDLSTPETDVAEGPAEDTAAPVEDTTPPDPEDVTADTAPPEPDVPEPKPDVTATDTAGSVPDVAPDVAPACPPGTLFCPCADGLLCDLGLRCNESAGLCEPKPQPCQPGSTGCACNAKGACARLADSCVDGTCQPLGCAPGSLNCACGSGCEAGLACVEGACQSAVGSLGGPCYDGGTCDHGNRCQGGVCVPCALGSLGCACQDGDCGSKQVCTQNLCVAENDPAAAPPTDPRCFTPCTDGYTDDDGAFHPCLEGLVSGCIAPNECVAGSCVTPGGLPPGCQNDSECAEFQRCILGTCYSDCESDAACGAGQICHQKACRDGCDQVSAPCPSGWHCEVSETLIGACRPLTEPEGVVTSPIDGSLSATPDLLTLDPETGAARIRVANAHSQPVTVTARKLRHSGWLANGTGNAAELDAQGTCAPTTSCPLWWLRIGPVGAATQQQEFTFTVPANGVYDLELTHAAASTAVGWQGDLELRSTLNPLPVALQYSPRPDGRWTGTAYYFTQFGVDDDFAQWKALQNPAPGSVGGALTNTKDDVTLVTKINNAFIQRWSAFRRGKIGWDEFQAVLASTRDGTWRFPATTASCDAPAGACYPYDAVPAGVQQYTNDQLLRPIPSGVVELPMGLAVSVDPGDPTSLSGRIETSAALHYAGDPAVSLSLDQPFGECSRETPLACINFLDAFDATAEVGGRYLSDSSDFTCAGMTADAAYVEVPWLVPGFTAGTELDPGTGARTRFECQSQASPWPAGSPGAVAENLNLARSNPIPDGRAIRRSVRLIDGALINQSVLLVIFEEHFESFLGASDTEGFSAYGLMLLTRDAAPFDRTDANTDGTPDLFEGHSYSAIPDPPSAELNVTCSEDVLDAVLGGAALTGGNAATLVRRLIDGSDTGGSNPPINPTLEQAHYYCEDTGLFDDGAAGTSTPCPEGSRVDYFTTVPGLVTIDQHACQQLTVKVVAADGTTSQRGTCGETLNAWRGGKLSGPFSPPLVQYRPAWRCKAASTGATVYCDANRANLLEGKDLLSASPNAFTPIQGTVDDAFRYKVKFQNRQGGNIGFAPSTCVPNSDQVPYCYDPAGIEIARARIDCLVHVWNNHWFSLDSLNQARLRNFLTENYSTSLEFRAGVPVSHDGFERLYAELLVMLGDEAYTRALSSRFDLASSQVLPFEGASLEPGGVNLSGIAGFELYSLYQATQYYEAALDHFYAQSPLIWSSLAQPSKNFVTAGLVTAYFSRLIGASAHQSRAASEIARKYQAINRADLARRVVERAYSRGYLESVVLSRLIQRIVEVSAPEDQAQIQADLERAALAYRQALLDMRNVYTSINDNVSTFGLTPGYIPFPTVDAKETSAANAFEQMMIRVKAKMQTAKEREDFALASDRAYETDAAEFQTELVRIRNTYEDQLAELCGLFTGPAGQEVPAIPKYAHLHPIGKALGDPCGWLGSGLIHQTVGDLEELTISAKTQLARIDRVVEQAAIEEQLQSDLCEAQTNLAEWVFDEAGKNISVRDLIRRLELHRTKTNGQFAAAKDLINAGTQLAQVTNPAAALVVSGAGLLEYGVNETQLYFTVNTQESIDEQQAALELSEALIVKNEKITEACTVGQLSSAARVKTLLLETKELELELTRVDHQLQLKLSEINRLRLKARRLMALQDEAEQLAINVEAAKNDPNIRIYRNDAVINADVAFDAALLELYKATLVLEYYTSQTFAQKGELFLVRMVAKGDYNLENYQSDLQDAFFEFEDNFGLPDLRVAVLSLKEDIFRIPRVNGDGIALDSSTRTKMLRARLGDNALLDPQGYRVMPFRTDLDALSPLTQNHKIAFIEADIVHTSSGSDEMARLYLRQRGTSVIRTIDGGKAFYQFPVKTAVLNPMRNGVRSPYLDPGIYRNTRLRERPFANTEWELVLNQVDEAVNADIELNNLDDIKLHIYYTDFTAY